jgi:Holliday junction resolvase RusA-like endonuclease
LKIKECLMGNMNPRKIKYQPEPPEGSLYLEFKGVPFSKQSFQFRSFITKSGKVAIQKYQQKKVVEGENTLKAQIIQQLPKGFVPFSKAVVVRRLRFIFPLPMSARKATKEMVNAGMTVYKTTKPDLTDNLMKGLFDAMSGIVFIDDARIAMICDCKKIYGNTPGISIWLDEIEAHM